MPELPDVEVFRRYIDSTSLHKKIINVDSSSDKILEDITSNYLTNMLQNNSLEETYRHGKYLFVHVTNGKWLVLHFGMTGFVKYFKNLKEKPSHTRVLLSFENKYHLAVHSQRLLGTVHICDDKEKYLQDHDLGPDALQVPFDTFKGLLQQRRGMVKSTLMNQSIIAGIGNIYADEICFQTGIHPKTKMNHLNEDELQTLYHHMMKIFEIAIDAKVNPNDFPDSFIIPQRSQDGTCPKDGESLQKIKVNGRTTYFCPVHQKRQ